MTQRTIDGFVQRTPNHTPVIQLARHPLRPMPIHQHPPAAPRPIQPTLPPATRLARSTPSTPPASRRPHAPVPSAKPLPKQRKRRGIPTVLQMPLIVMGAMLAGILAQSEAIGQLFVVVYGIAALIWKIPSRTTFFIALLSLITTTLLLVVRGNVSLAQSFATYTFLLLVAGVITLCRELKKEGGRIYSNRKIISNN